MPRARGLAPLGLPELRRAIATHLLRARGLVSDRHEVVTAGTMHGLRLVLDALRLRGRQVAMEEPAAMALRQAAHDGHCGPLPLPADREGARFDAVPDCCRVAVLSPDANVPMGYVLSEQRRRQAALWAARRAAQRGGALVEIACDSVFRPAASRLPRLVDLTRGEQPPYLPQLALAHLLAGDTVVRPDARARPDLHPQAPPAGRGGRRRGMPGPGGTAARAVLVLQPFYIHGELPRHDHAPNPSFRRAEQRVVWPSAGGEAWRWDEDHTPSLTEELQCEGCP